MFGEELLFPFELTFSDYLRRLLVCIAQGIRGPICHIVSKDCVPLGLMESMTSFDSRDPVALLRVIVGAYRVCGMTKKEIEGHSFDIQSIFYTYIGNRKTYVQSVHTLLREAMFLSLREYHMEMGGKLPNMSIPFEAARNLLESFTASFECCQLSLIHVMELQSQCESHRMSKEERCLRENLQWPKCRSENIVNIFEIIDTEFQIAEKNHFKPNKTTIDFSMKVSKTIDDSTEIFLKSRKLLQSSEIYKYICLGRLNGMKVLLEVRASTALKHRQINLVKEQRKIHQAITDTAGVISGSIVSDTSISLEEKFSSQLEVTKQLASDLQSLEEECLVLEEIELLSDLQSCRADAVQLMLEINEIIAAPGLTLHLPQESRLTSDLLFTTPFRDGLSIEILSFKISSVAVCRSILQWPDITMWTVSSSQLDGLIDEEISDPLRLRLAGVPANKLLRIGLTTLELLKVGFSIIDIKGEMFSKEDNKGRKVAGKYTSCDYFEELLYALKAERYDAAHCLSVGFKLKDLLRVGFGDHECMKAIIVKEKFVAIGAIDSPISTAIHSNSPSSSVFLSEVINSKLLRSLNLDFERYALTKVFQALDGPNWRCKDNWLSDKPLSMWYGVICKDYGLDSRVTKLSLRGNMMMGKVPNSLIYLELLQSLDFGFNDISGSVFDIIKLLPNLKDIWLERNERIIENVDYASKSRLKDTLQKRSRSHYNIRLDTVSPPKNFRKVSDL